ncbi:hypothetical protein ACIQI7_14615 [Kitasatospora sp. NPDC092039]|uniref:aromatic-ring hydroxylase C-terminal domain-containing protein n=1 Tax=Kitasatospora sp. NPDC092039 TaxID=3364086 RepID=UPI003804A743
MYRRTSGLFHRYDLGGEQPLVGHSAPGFRFRDGTRPGELLSQGRGVLLDFRRDGALRAAAGGWAGRIHHAAGPARDDLGFAALLVRPDGVVAWADGHADAEAFQRAASRWFGRPSGDRANP